MGYRSGYFFAETKLPPPKNSKLGQFVRNVSAGAMLYKHPPQRPAHSAEVACYRNLERESVEVSVIFASAI
jgi:hypothetical protein